MKRLRESRQRGGKPFAGTQNGPGPSASGADPPNQLMQAFINQSVGMKPVTAPGVVDLQGYQGHGPIRATENTRIRAASDLKKSGINMGVKI